MTAQNVPDDGGIDLVDPNDQSDSVPAELNPEAVTDFDDTGDDERSDDDREGE